MAAGAAESDGGMRLDDSVLDRGKETGREVGSCAWRVMDAPVTAIQRARPRYKPLSLS